MKPCIFFDRDGVVNQDPGAGYVLRAADFHFNPGILEALEVVWQKGYEAALITNQRGVFKGLMSLEDLEDIHAHMQAEIARRTGRGFLAVKACLDGDRSSPRRKPQPGMVLEALEEFDLDPARSWFIGDQSTDIQCALNAGLTHTIRILNPTRAIGDFPATHSLDTVEGLAELLRRVL